MAHILLGWLRPPFPLSSHASSLSSRPLHRADTNDGLSTLPPSTLAVCLGLGGRQKEAALTKAMRATTAATKRVDVRAIVKIKWR